MKDLSPKDLAILIILEWTLSGGIKNKIGLAINLYKNPMILKIRNLITHIIAKTTKTLYLIKYTAVGISTTVQWWYYYSG